MYAEDLAHIQHAGFGDFARRAAPGLLRALGRAGIRGGTVLDLGCGAGVWLRELRRAGYEAHGLDSSAELVRIARRAARGATVRVGSLYTERFPPCDAITAIGEVLGYCPPRRGRVPGIGPLFARAHRSLSPGGLFLFDLVVDARGAAGRTWRAGAGWAVLAESTEERGRRRLVREITTFRRVGELYRRASERHELRIVPRREVEAELRSAGFTVRASRRYGSFVLPPGRMAFSARKR